MSVIPHGFSVKALLDAEATRWDRRIALDLSTEIESQLAEKADTIPEMRRLLAVKGYRELRARLEREIGHATGTKPFGRWASAVRAFAHERPGLSAATFRNAITDSPEWQQEYQLLGGVALGAFESAGVKGEQAMNALGILRALVRGFVLHEMAASFLDTVDYDKLYAVAVDVFSAWTRFGQPRNRLSVADAWNSPRNGTVVPFCFFVGNRTDRFSTGALDFFVMTATKRPDPEFLPIHRPRCPDCQTRMITIAVASATDGFERRTFECRKCGHGKTELVISDPLKSDAAGWTAGELRRPN